MSAEKPGIPGRGVLLANLGTPEAPTRAAVARFLREFLADPRVVDLPRYLWLPLLYGVIVPLRAGRSAAAYRRIWWSEGSPLLALSRRISEGLAGRLGRDFVVALGMRYGQPSVKEALAELQRAGVERVTVLPLYPQYSATTTESIYDAVEAALAALDWRPRLDRVQQYFDREDWVRAVADSVSRYRAEHGSAQRLLFSMHGIPQRYVEAGDPYALQCLESVQAVAQELDLTESEWVLCYQSRVGREPWLQPHTDQTLRQLAASGVRRVQVICPGFATDCLETLEEIEILNREQFLAAGGESLSYIPALNDSEAHLSLLAALAAEPGNAG